MRVPTGGGGGNVLVGGRLQLGLRFWFPPDPRRRCCSTFLNWKGYCYHKILIIRDGDPSFPVHPCFDIEMNRYMYEISIVHFAGKEVFSHMTFSSTD